ncbi:MAG: ornithine carbamoyltransferase [Phycisphaerae bacterium]|jgi:ornithine carbamoyltransferase|nr:ornithine carbamoyltransferase [Phycisphaerae bacterium]
MSTEIPECLQSLKHFLSIQDLSSEALQALIDFSIRRKGQFKRGELKPVLERKVLAMLFQKSSLRTRLGFETAMIQLGGYAVCLEDHQIGLAKREEPKDIARVMSAMCDGIMARVKAHQILIELAARSTVPVINGLSDWSHPCQALADVMTLQEHFGSLTGRKLAFIGDGNNVARSLLSAGVKLGMSFALAAPKKYQFDDGVIQSAHDKAGKNGATIIQTEQPDEAAADADVLYTDVWTSMGQESERSAREADFTGYQINAALVKKARPKAVVMHCLPAYRGLEITDEVMDSSQSVVFQQAENRLHSQRALLEVLLGRRK